MIENSMVIGDYYEGCTYGKCEDCGCELTEDDNDDPESELCDNCAQVRIVEEEESDE
jgi:hypothetical protein